MIFGRKNNNDKVTKPASKKNNAENSGSQSEIELACRDLMLASLESMRKEVIHRPSRAEMPEAEVELSFDLPDNSEESIATEDGFTSEISEHVIVEDNVDSVCSPIEEISAQPDFDNAVNGRVRVLDSDKQKIIDIIVAEDIRRAFSPDPDSMVS